VFAAISEAWDVVKWLALIGAKDTPQFVPTTIFSGLHHHLLKLFVITDYLMVFSSSLGSS
jgi:hypothetical protein